VEVKGNFMKQRTYLEDFLKSPLRRICFYVLLAFMAAWFHNLENSDELWNYAFGSNIANGLLPYRDFNLLQTPLSCVINGLAIRIFGHHLLVIRMMGVLLFTGIAIMADRISGQLGAKGIYRMFVPTVFLCMFFWNVFLEYSCLILFFELCLLSFDLDWCMGRNKKISAQLCAGVLMGCAMMCKQTFGTFVAAASWISVVCVCRMSGMDFKKCGKALFLRMLGTSIPCFAFLFYLLGTHTFADFWDMAFRGISTFSARYSYWTFMKENPAYFFLGALLPVLGICAVEVMIRSRGTARAQKTLLVVLYALFGCINMVPMANSYHVMTCSIPILFLLFTVLPEKLFYPKSCSNKAQRVCAIGLKAAATVSVAGVAVFIVLVNPIDDCIHYDLVTDVRGLECTFMTEKQHDEIVAVDAYVEEQNGQGVTVYMLDNFAPLYFLPSNQYHKYYDMFLYGNLGTKTPTQCLEEIEETAIILKPDRSRSQTQYPRTEIEAFLEEWQQAGTVGSFTVYEKK
jgi:hypothetical protein